MNFVMTSEPIDTIVFFTEGATRNNVRQGSTCNVYSKSVALTLP